MSGFGRVSEALAVLVLGAVPGLADTPARVVSINLCTDLLAMRLAPDLLIAVSPIATDPLSSHMSVEASQYLATDGTAEDIFLMTPDLVLAGSYSERATVEMLRRLGIAVEEFPPATSLDDIRSQLRRMGGLLGREAEAEAEVAAFDARIAGIAPPTGDRPRAMAFFANGWSLGRNSLVGSAIEAAGFSNVTAERDVEGGALVSLEDLIVEAPDLIVSGERYPGHSRSEDIVSHPALRTVTDGREIAIVPDRDWICGSPDILSAIEKLAFFRRDLE